MRRHSPDAMLDPAHERREERFGVDCRTCSSATMPLTRIREEAVELLRLLVVTLQHAVVVMVGPRGKMTRKWPKCAIPELSCSAWSFPQAAGRYPRAPRTRSEERRVG